MDLNDTVMEDLSKTEQDSAPLLSADNADNDPNDVKVIGGGGGNFDIIYCNLNYLKLTNYRWERPYLDVVLGGQGAGRPAGPGEQFGLAVVLVVGG